MTTALQLDSSEMQRVARDFVEGNVYCNIGALMEYAIQKSVEDNYAPVHYEEIPFQVDPGDWNATQLKEYISDNFSMTWEEVTGEPWEKDEETAEIDPETDEPQVLHFTVADDEERYEDEIEKARDCIRDNAEQREVYEWWAVSQWLAERLKERGYIVVDEMGAGLYVWGRETTGQAIYMDYAIQEITNQWRALRGE